MAAFRTFQVWGGFKRHESKNLFECRQAGAKLFNRVFLHESHPIRSGSVSDLVHIPCRTDHRASGIIEAKQLINSQSALISCLIAQFTPDGYSHLRGGLEVTRQCDAP